MGGILLFLFLQGAWIVYPYGTIGIAVLTILWVVSFPVIHFFLCRHCYNCGKRCAIPGEGDLANLLFKPKPGSPGLTNWLGTALSYLLRMGYPAALLILHPENHTAWIKIVYPLTLVVFLTIDSRVFGCPYCKNILCPLNPDYGKGSECADVRLVDNN